MQTGGSRKAAGVLSSLLRADLHAALTRYADLALAALVVLVVGMMVIPLPTPLLDVFIALNIAVSVTLLLLALYVSDALKIATFPTLLLLTTLFRLGLEVSATRLILMRADAGEVIHAFGNFVVAGNLVVGVVIFAILTFIQIVVIAKGSERVAEVGARFALDALPGKQMAIDAELRAGHIDEAEARRRRAALARESQFFGAMDGAMKFVKGDAMAGVVVLLTNIVGGLVIGVVQRGLDAGTAARTYTLLTIGEGLVTQIPALIVSTAAGILVTRVSAEPEAGQPQDAAGGHLGRDVGRQILAQPKALGVVAVLMTLLGLVPGLPTAPFLFLAALFGFVAIRLLRAKPAPLGEERSLEAGGAPTLEPLAIELSPALAMALATDDGSSLLDQAMPALRRQFFEDAGLNLPAVRVRSRSVLHEAGRYQLLVNEVPRASGEVVTDCVLAVAPPLRLHELALAGRAAEHPDGREATWIARDDEAAARGAGLEVLGPTEVITAHLVLVLHRHAHELLGIQEVRVLLDALGRTHPALVNEVVPRIVSPAVLAEVLRRLAQEGISLRVLPEVLEVLAARETGEKDSFALTEQVRAALRRQITFKYAGAGETLGAFLLEPMIEQVMRDSIHGSAGGRSLALEPALGRDIVEAVGRAVGSGAAGRGRPPVVVTSGDIRRHVRELIEAEHPKVVVLAYQELMPETKVQAIGHIKVGA